MPTQENKLFSALDVADGKTKYSAMKSSEHFRN